MPNARPTPGLRLTPENREQLRGLTEAIEHGTARFITYEADLAARAFREIERLRREREVLAEAVMGWQRYLERDVGTEIVHVRTLEAHGRALALLGGEEGGGDDGR